MKRRDLLKSLGAVGIGTILPIQKTLGEINKLNKKELMKSADCWLTPAKTEGPFYFNSNLFRQDIRTDSDTGEFHDGVQLNMTITVIDVNCNPVQNVLVDIWHTDKDGIYSGFVQAGSAADQDFMRGIQITDAGGKASFITSYPGWYPGRATHIHFKVRLDSKTFVTSQFAFPDSLNEAVYATPLYANRGQNPMSNEEDNIFGTANPEYLVMAGTPISSGGYDGTFTIGINAPLTGYNENENQPEGFHLEQNYPNPFNPSTTIKYSIPSGSDVKLSVFDVFGQEVETLVKSRQSAGAYEIVFNAKELSSGLYVYRLTAKSEADNFVKSKEMLLIK